MPNEKLLQLAAYLKTVEEKNFDMGVWFQTPEPAVGQDPDPAAVDWTCNTSACAIGHAFMIPAFRDAGLELIKVRDVDELEDGRLVISFKPAYKGYAGTRAVARFFDISIDEAERLFVDYAALKRTLSEEIAFIEEFAGRCTASPRLRW